ncbi:protein of unknown function [Methanoculleus bourgensis]|uniref:Uncharacterized protein n=1 Tax=Methanoculleus bourgensis TaxID=83986 RepID=A0A0X3BMB3_9EURY|nr:protein of unknown function [Methanoculleus bourgensis]
MHVCSLPGLKRGTPIGIYPRKCFYDPHNIINLGYGGASTVWMNTSWVPEIYLHSRSNALYLHISS